MIRVKYYLWKNKKNISIFLLMVVLFFVLGMYTLFTYFNYIIPASKRTDTAPAIDTASVEDAEEIELGNCREVSQTFDGDKYGISAIKIKIINNGLDDTEKLTVKLIDLTDDEDVYIWKKDLSDISSDGLLTVKLKKEIKDAGNTKYSIVISGGNNDCIIYKTKDDVYYSGQLYVDGIAQISDTRFTIVPATVNNHFIIKFFLCVICGLLFLTILMFLLVNSSLDISLEYMFLICMFFLGGAFLITTPAFSVPDEMTHFVTSYRISNNILRQKDDTNEEYVLCREIDALKREMTHETTLETYRYIKDNVFSDMDNGNYVLFTDTSIKVIRSPLISHLPQALGITIARLLHTSNVTLIFIGQFCSFIVYLLLVFFAIRIIPVGKQLLFAISALPMMLHIITSFSYDSIICGMSFLLIAYIMKMIYEKEKVSIKDCIIVFVISILLAPCKMVYSFITLILLLVPNKKYRSILFAYTYKACTILFSIGYAFIFNMSEVAGDGTGVKMIEWAGAQGYTLSDLLHNVPNTINIYVCTLHDMLGMYINTMLGGQLGWMLLDMPLDIVVLLVVIIVVSLREYKVYRITGLHKIVYVGVFLLVSVLVLTSMLLGWTPTYSKTILGVQGRYFLPVLPLLLIPFLDATSEQQKKARKWLVVCSCIVNYMVLLRIFEINVMK